MILKRLIAISVVFALVAGTAFAVDLGGNVIGTVNFLEGSNAKDANDNTYPLGASAGMNRIRLEGSGENDDGTFGGWIRFDMGGDATALNPQPWEAPGFLAASLWGHAWWKPIDMLKLWIGSNGGDGFFGKEGVTGWMFYQTASDTGVVNPGNVWGGSYLGGDPVIFRNAFYAGGIDGGNAFYMTISPIDLIDINIEVPFFNGEAYDPDTNPGGSASYIFQRTVAQVDVKLDFGNIALTYAGAGNKYEPTLTIGPTGIPDLKGAPDPGKFFLYFGLTSIENLGIDVGLGFPLPLNHIFEKDELGAGFPEVKVTRVSPLAAGLGVKFTTGSFGIKARFVANFAGSVKAEPDQGTAPDPLKDPVNVLVDILPFFSINDNLTVFLSAGLGIAGKAAKNDDWGKAEGDSTTAWHINPYVQAGQEWGPKFLAGLRLQGSKTGDADGSVSWSIPLALHVGF